MFFASSSLKRHQWKCCSVSCYSLTPTITPRRR